MQGCIVPPRREPMLSANKTRFCTVTILFLLLAIIIVAPAVAQTDSAAPAQSPSNQTQSSQTSSRPPAPSTQTAPVENLLKPEQLEALVAPIALYPDALLVNVLAAS